MAPPTAAAEGVYDDVVATAGAALTGPASRVLCYCPDALGTHFVDRYADVFAPVRAAAPVAVAVRAILPTITPVNFASLFTGATPAVHGVAGTVRPVVATDSLFDAWPRAGVRVALVAVKGSSLDLIFRGRPVDYYVEDYDPAVTARAAELIAGGRHDVVVVYHQEYDDCLHRTTPESEEALRAAANHAAAFATLAAVARERWRGADRMVCFAPDHGAHVNAATGRGTHGADVTEDRDVTHFFGFGAGRA